MLRTMGYCLLELLDTIICDVNLIKERTVSSWWNQGVRFHPPEVGPDAEKPIMAS